MRVTVDGWRLAPSVLDDTVHSGAKPSIKVAKSPEVVWDGNPYCPPGSVLCLLGYPGAGATIRDFSGQGNDATRTGATWTRLPSGLWYLDFDGAGNTSTCGVGTNLAVSGLTTFGLGFWLYPRSDGEGNTARAFSRNIFEVKTVNEVGGAVKFEFFVSHDGVASTNAITNLRYAINTWHHVFFNYNENADKKGTIYVNEALVALSTDVAGIGAIVDDSAQETFIGNWVGGNRTLDGGIAIVRQCAEYQTADEIANMRNQERHLFGV